MRPSDEEAKGKVYGSRVTREPGRKIRPGKKKNSGITKLPADKKNVALRRPGSPRKELRYPGSPKDEKKTATTTNRATKEREFLERHHCPRGLRQAGEGWDEQVYRRIVFCIGKRVGVV